MTLHSCIPTQAVSVFITRVAGYTLEGPGMIPLRPVMLWPMWGLPRCTNHSLLIAVTTYCRPVCSSSTPHFPVQQLTPNPHPTIHTPHSAPHNPHPTEIKQKKTKWKQWMASPTSSTATAIAISASCWQASHASYRSTPSTHFTCTVLVHIPGPRLAALTNLYHVYHMYH